MEFLSENWMGFMGGFMGCGILTVILQISMMSKMECFLDEGFGFFKRAIPQTIMGFASLGCFILMVIGIIGKFVGVETGVGGQ